MIPIALQLYSVKNECAADLPGVLRQVAAMGYDGVEFAGFHGCEAQSLRDLLDELGLRVAGSHTALSLLEGEAIAQTIAFHQTLGCEYLIVPSIPKEQRSTREQCERTGALLTQLADQLRPHGLRAGFHCHAQDVRSLGKDTGENADGRGGGGESAWDVLAANTPDDFVLEYDTANGMDGGDDPVQPLRNHPGRGELTHLKEYVRDGGHGQAVIGEGDVPWPDVFEACKTVAGTTWYIVEHEGHPTLTPLVAVEKCLKNLRTMETG